MSMPLAEFSPKKIFSQQKVIRNRLLNLLGVQVLRASLARLILRIRRRSTWGSPGQNGRELCQTGCFAVQDFLEPQDFERISLEFERAVKKMPSATELTPDFYNQIRQSISISADDSDEFPETIGKLLHHPMLLELFGIQEGIRSDDLGGRGSFKFRFERASKLDGELENGSDDSTAKLHVDTFHTISKAFFYANDVDESNGAFRYVKHSNKLSLKRLWDEYVGSVRKLDIAYRISDESAHRYGELVSMEFPANSIVICDAGGFHGRGYFAGQASRDLIYIEYRSNPFKLF